MQNQKLLRTVRFGCFEVDFWLTDRPKKLIKAVSYFFWYHWNCFKNLVKGKRYRDKTGRIFNYHAYIVRYLAGSPEKKGIPVDLSFWDRGAPLGLIAPFHGFFDYSIGRWVTNKRELNNRLKKDGKIFASDQEIAQEAKYRRELIQKEDAKQLKSETRALVHKNFKNWRDNFSKGRAEANYKELVAANRKAQEQE